MLSYTILYDTIQYYDVLDLLYRYSIMTITCCCLAEARGNGSELRSPRGSVLCIYIYIYVYTHTYIYIYIYIYTHRYTYIYMWIYIYVHTCMLCSLYYITLCYTITLYYLTYCQVLPRSGLQCGDDGRQHVPLGRGAVNLITSYYTYIDHSYILLILYIW